MTVRWAELDNTLRGRLTPEEKICQPVQVMLSTAKPGSLTCASYCAAAAKRGSRVPGKIIARGPMRFVLYQRAGAQRTGSGCTDDAVSGQQINNIWVEAGPGLAGARCCKPG